MANSLVLVKVAKKSKINKLHKLLHKTTFQKKINQKTAYFPKDISTISKLLPHKSVITVELFQGSEVFSF